MIEDWITRLSRCASHNKAECEHCGTYMQMTDEGDPCVVNVLSSRVCVYGTIACTSVHHPCEFEVKPGLTCDGSPYDKYGRQDKWFCWQHGMDYLASLKQEAEARREDRCEDGPHCGCDQHRGGYEE